MPYLARRALSGSPHFQTYGSVVPALSQKARKNVAPGVSANGVQGIYTFNPGNSQVSCGIKRGGAHPAGGYRGGEKTVPDTLLLPSFLADARFVGYYDPDEQDD